jgi:hypothetical protein
MTNRVGVEAGVLFIEHKSVVTVQGVPVTAVVHMLVCKVIYDVGHAITTLMLG